MNTREWRITRAELYEKLWSRTLTEVAKEYDVWNGELVAISDAYEIPRPPMGYWMKVKHGKKVKIPPLKPLPDREEIVRELYVHPEKLVDPEQHSEATKQVAAEHAAENRIIVMDELVDPHPLVARAEKSLRNAPQNDWTRLVPRTPRCLDIRTSKSGLDRALRIMDALLKALEAREVKIDLLDDRSMSTRVTVLGEEFGITIEEIIKRTERALTPAEERAQKRDPWSYRHPVYNYHPTGQFVLRLGNGARSYWRKNWSDGKVQRLENMLNKVVRNLFECAVAKRSDRLEREAAERRWEEERKRQAEIRSLQAEERKRVEQLDKDVDAWERSQTIRAYVETVRQSFEKDNITTYRGQPVADWIKWALEQADREDPLCKSPYSVLDERVSPWW